MTQDSGITAVAHVIQLSVAPVFLLSGIGAMLAVMTNRLARVIDRARTLEEKATADPAGTPLLVCGVIATLFLGAFFGFDASGPAALLFVTAMFAFMAGLLLFVREVLRATANLRIGRHPTRE